MAKARAKKRFPRKQKVKAHIYIDSTNEARVYPPVLVVDKFTRVEIHNTTNETYDLTFPGGVLVGNNKKSIDTQTTAELVGKTRGVFFYSGEGISSGKKLKGNSDPVIIIEM